MIFNPSHLQCTLFIDIETASEYKEYDELTDLFKSLWVKKASQLDKALDISNEDAIRSSYKAKAGIFSEFSKIICIGVGYIKDEEEVRLKSISHDDEKDILLEFANLINNYYNDPSLHFICGHNIKEFDIPFICRRLVKNRIDIPDMLKLSGKKPWQTEYLVDTMDMWRFGDYKNYTSMNLIAAVLDIESPKDDIDGSQVGSIYWEENDLARIVKYCLKDVVTVIQIMRKYSGMELIDGEKIRVV